MNDKDRPCIYPQEMPSGENKDYGHGVIENVVKHEINPESSQNPATPADTDSINNEFARKHFQENL